MSTNKTPNYQLHSWTPEDEFHVSEINENFAKLDDVLLDKLEVAFGSYIGDGISNHLISLGRVPVAVHIEDAGGTRELNSCYGGLFPLGEIGSLGPAEDGFIIRGAKLNCKNYTYYFMAFFLA